MPESVPGRSPTRVQQHTTATKLVRNNRPEIREFRPVLHTRVTLANRRLRPLGHLTADGKYTEHRNLCKASRSGGDGFSVRDQCGFGQKSRYLPCRQGFTSQHGIEEIANVSPSQPQASGIVQDILQCFAGLLWAPLQDLSIAHRQRREIEARTPSGRSGTVRANTLVSPVPAHITSARSIRRRGLPRGPERPRGSLDLRRARNGSHQAREDLEPDQERRWARGDTITSPT